MRGGGGGGGGRYRNIGPQVHGRYNEWKPKVAWNNLSKALRF